MTGLDHTHDPARRSWVETANDPAADFPLQNLPYGVFSVGGGERRVGVAIGDRILDLSLLEAAGLVQASDAPVFDRREINAFMALGPAVWRATRGAIGDLLDTSDARLRGDPALAERALVRMADAALHLPLFVRSFTDFYASRAHATNVGTMFRGADHALTPNWLHIPIGYNGRASTVVVSGTAIRRPLGQLKAPADDAPRFGPSQKLDLELELGAVVGVPNAMGQPVTTQEAYAMIFGYVLLNDWSARDIQAWEYQPLGPFQSKAFATTISPWIVTSDALAPFRVAGPEKTRPLLPYLVERAANNFDLELAVELTPADRGPTTISRTNFRHMYYSSAQQLTHHAASGCAMCTGDLLGSGTVSGATRASCGSLLELTWNGKEPLEVDGGTRSFIEDGDTLTLTGHCQGAGHRVGFGACAGRILPAPAEPEW